MSPSRREVMWGVAGLLAVAWGCGGDQPAAAFELAGWLPPEAGRLGRSYLTVHDETDEQLLMALIGTTESVPADARERVLAAIQADFASGDVVAIGGWRLSRTECRLCALVHRVAPEWGC